MNIDYEELADRVNQLFDENNENMVQILQSNSNEAWSALCRDFAAGDFTDELVWQKTTDLQYAMDVMEDADNLEERDGLLRVGEKITILLDLWMPKLQDVLSRTPMDENFEDGLDSVTILFMQLFVVRTNLLMSHGWMETVDSVARRDPVRHVFSALRNCYRETRDRDAQQDVLNDLIAESFEFTRYLESTYVQNSWGLLGMSDISSEHTRIQNVGKRFDLHMLEIVARFGWSINAALQV